MAWLSREERKTLKAALEPAGKKRAQSGSRDGSGMIDELTAQEFPARYFVRKVALCVAICWIWQPDRAEVDFDSQTFLQEAPIP